MKNDGSSDDDNIAEYLKSGDYIPMQDFLDQHSTFFEAQGYRVKRVGINLELTQFRDGHTHKIPLPFNSIKADLTPEEFIAEIKTTLQELETYVPMKDFFEQNAAFFEAHGYRVKKAFMRLSFTRLSDGHTIKIPMPFSRIEGNVTPEAFLTQIENSFRELESFIPLQGFLDQHAAFFEAHGYQVKKAFMRLAFTRLKDGQTITIPMPFNVIPGDQTRESFLANIENGFREKDR